MNLSRIIARRRFLQQYRRARPGEALTRAERTCVYLEGELKLEEGRIVVDGGYREKATIELFAVRVGARPPEPTPTVSPGEVQILGGKVKAGHGTRRVKP